jgi:hypothetical protein
MIERVRSSAMGFSSEAGRKPTFASPKITEKPAYWRGFGRYGYGQFYLIGARFSRFRRVRQRRRTHD